MQIFSHGPIAVIYVKFHDELQVSDWLFQKHYSHKTSKSQIVFL